MVQEEKSERIVGQRKRHWSGLGPGQRCLEIGQRWEDGVLAERRIHHPSCLTLPPVLGLSGVNLLLNNLHANTTQPTPTRLSKQLCLATCDLQLVQCRLSPFPNTFAAQKKECVPTCWALALANSLRKSRLV